MWIDPVYVKQILSMRQSVRSHLVREVARGTVKVYECDGVRYAGPSQVPCELNREGWLQVQRLAAVMDGVSCISRDTGRTYVLF